MIRTISLKEKGYSLKSILSNHCSLKMQTSDSERLPSILRQKLEEAQKERDSLENLSPRDSEKIKLLDAHIQKLTYLVCKAKFKSDGEIQIPRKFSR